LALAGDLADSEPMRIAVRDVLKPRGGNDDGRAPGREVGGLGGLAVEDADAQSHGEVSRVIR
jgi:hypothetical protein